MAGTMVDDNTVRSYVNSYLDAHLPELLKNYQLEERARIVRVEDGIQSQGKLLEKMLQQMDKRFEQVDKRFEQVDKRFEQVDKRFETVDRRFETLTDQMNQRFNHMFRFMSLGFVVLTVLMTLYQYL